MKKKIYQALIAGVILATGYVCMAIVSILA